VHPYNERRDPDLHAEPEFVKWSYRDFEAIVAVAEVLGAMPSLGDYDAVRRLERPELPSNATIRGRCGGWARVLALAEGCLVSPPGERNYRKGRP